MNNLISQNTFIYKYLYLCIICLAFSQALHSQADNVSEPVEELIENITEKRKKDEKEKENNEEQDIEPVNKDKTDSSKAKKGKKERRERPKEIDENREESIRSLIPDLTYQKKSGLGTAISKIYFSDQKFTISGFFEANAVHYESEQIREGDLELYYTNLYRSGTYFGYKITDNIIFNSEIQLEYLNDGNKERHHEVNIEALVDFLIHPMLNVRVGNFPIPLGYININEEPVMFHSVNRPDVERILIPTQWLEWGSMLFGSIIAGFDYNIAVMQGLNAENFKEGSWIRSGRDFKYNGMQDVAYLAKLEWNGLDDFTVGLGYYGGRSGQGMRTLDNRKINAEVSLAAFNLFYKYEFFQITSVGVLGRMTDTEKIYQETNNILGERVYGGYFDLGIDTLYFLKNKFPILKSSYELLIFGRYERLDTHDKIHPGLRDLARSQKDMKILTYGINYRPKKNMVFKMNYQFRKNNYNSAGNIEDPNRLEFGIGFIY